MTSTQTSGTYEHFIPEYAAPVPYTTFHKALELACYFQNRCCDLEEIVEHFCLDAEDELRSLK